MNLLILNGPADPRAAQRAAYKGTYRAHPTYSEHLPQAHEQNQLFLWFLEEGGESGVVHDFDKALRFTRLLNENVFPGRGRFELIEVTDSDYQPETNGRMLGFDLSANYNNSLLWWGLNPPSEASLLPKPIIVLTELLHNFYAPKLNDSLLFPSAETARRCLTAMDALQELCPNLYEGESLLGRYSVTGAYLVSI